MSYAPSLRTSRGPAHAYAALGLETQVMSASPVRLITLLFDGACAALVRARIANERCDAAARGQAISKAIDIVENGLKASLDMQAGGELARTLRDTYDLIVRTLLLANLKGEPKYFASAEQLLTSLGQAWRLANDADAA